MPTLVQRIALSACETVSFPTPTNPVNLPQKTLVSKCVVIALVGTRIEVTNSERHFRQNPCCRSTTCGHVQVRSGRYGAVVVPDRRPRRQSVGVYKVTERKSVCPMRSGLIVGVALLLNCRRKEGGAQLWRGNMAETPGVRESTLYGFTQARRSWRRCCVHLQS